MADKVDVKDMLNQPDEFITFTDKLIKWGQENLKIVIAICVAFIVAVSLVVGINAYLDYRSDQAAQAMSEAYDEYMKIVVGQDKSPDLGPAVEGLSKATGEYGATAAGVMGRMALGHLLLEKGDWTGAEALFSELSDEPDLAEVLKPLAWHGLGKAYEGQKKYDQAAQAYESAYQIAGKSLKSVFMYDQARVLQAKGNKDQASGLYKKLIADFPEDPYALRAKAALVAMDIDPAG
jgi:predicted negative regulator of RcsB-dependent stress response